MKKILPLLLIAMLFCSCKKYRLAHAGCKEGAGCVSGGFLPNIFTPNGDGVNDTFKLYRSDSTFVSSFHIVIKNTFGVKVFESSDPNFVWTGTDKKGCTLKDDVYHTTVNSVSRFGSNRDISCGGKGTVTIFRDNFKKFCPKYFEYCGFGSQWNGKFYDASISPNEFHHYDCD